MYDVISVNGLASDQDRFAMSIIESKGGSLPATIEEIIPILAFSQAKMKAFNALSDAAKKVQDQEALNQAALESGQRWGIVHLYGQKRLGEITSEMPTKKVGRLSSSERLDEEGKQDKLQKQGISKDSYTEAERIAAHPDILEKVIEDAKERGDIPTKGAVLSRIKAETWKNMAASAPKEVDDISDVALTIYNRLGDDYAKLMKMWPHKDRIDDNIKNQIVDIIEALYNLTQED